MVGLALVKTLLSNAQMGSTIWLVKQRRMPSMDNKISWLDKQPETPLEQAYAMALDSHLKVIQQTCEDDKTLETREQHPSLVHAMDELSQSPPRNRCGGYLLAHLEQAPTES
jgi:hypothetical protein